MKIEELVEAKLLRVGDELVWSRRSSKKIHVSTINEDGTISTEDGKKHRTPSGAARHVNDGKPVDGWLVWKLKSNGVSLSKLRNELN